MLNDKLDIRRHQTVFQPHNFKDQIHIIGAGATGSWVAYQLAKLGIDGSQIHLYDFDKVEAHNVPNQLFGLADVPRKKVNAVSDRIIRDTQTEIVTHDKYENQRISGYVFLLVDSMSERKRIYKNLKRNTRVQLLVEPRMGVDSGLIYNLQPSKPSHQKMYEQTFYSDEEAEVSACGTSVTAITSAMMLASHVTRQLMNHHNGVELDNEIIIDMLHNNMMTTRW